MSEQLTLNTDDSYIVLKFLGIGSAQLTMHPANVVPVQLLAAAELLRWQAEKMLNDEWEKRNPPVQKIAIAKVA